MENNYRLIVYVPIKFRQDYVYGESEIEKLFFDYAEEYLKSEARLNQESKFFIILPPGDELPLITNAIGFDEICRLFLRRKGVDLRKLLD